MQNIEASGQEEYLDSKTFLLKDHQIYANLYVVNIQKFQYISQCNSMIQQIVRNSELIENLEKKWFVYTSTEILYVKRKTY